MKDFEPIVMGFSINTRDILDREDKNLPIELRPVDVHLDFDFID